MGIMKTELLFFCLSLFYQHCRIFGCSIVWAKNIIPRISFKRFHSNILGTITKNYQLQIIKIYRSDILSVFSSFPLQTNIFLGAQMQRKWPEFVAQLASLQFCVWTNNVFIVVWLCHCILLLNITVLLCVCFGRILHQLFINDYYFYYYIFGKNDIFDIFSFDVRTSVCIVPLVLDQF